MRNATKKTSTASTESANEITPAEPLSVTDFVRVWRIRMDARSVDFALHLRGAGMFAWRPDHADYLLVILPVAFASVPVPSFMVYHVQSTEIVNPEQWDSVALREAPRMAVKLGWKPQQG